MILCELCYRPTAGIVRHDTGAAWPCCVQCYWRAYHDSGEHEYVPPVEPEAAQP